MNLFSKMVIAQADNPKMQYDKYFSVSIQVQKCLKKTFLKAL